METGGWQGCSLCCCYTKPVMRWGDLLVWNGLWRELRKAITIRFTNLPKDGMKGSITYYLGGSISWESCCYQLIGSLSSAWDMLYPQKELKRRSYWMQLTICLKNSPLGNCRNGVQQSELI